MDVNLGRQGAFINEGEIKTSLKCITENEDYIAYKPLKELENSVLQHKTTKLPKVHEV
jgi:hypothetical protein